VAHNASFDMKFLLYKMNKNGITYKKYRVIDTLPLARKYIKTSNHKLVTLKKHFKLYDYKSHNALDDCYVTGKVYKHCYEMEINPPLLTFKDVDDYENAFELYDIGERLYKNKQLEDAEKYLLASIDKGNDAPAPFERLAIMYRKQKRYQDEINICELGLKAISNGPAAYQSNLFIKRIERAKELL
ncbi:MAG TPA: exonuclease domain-containing protein, partial [Pseudogracilibacillus sp.]|nr:exonuclease domain-containing protein [Pseudogracilibacillus sp.]